MPTIKAKQTQFIDVEIDEDDIAKLIREGRFTNLSALLWGARSQWLAENGLPRDAYIKKLDKKDAKGNWWVEDNEYHTSHSWSSTEEIRKANGEEVKVWKMFEKLGDAIMA